METEDKVKTFPPPPESETRKKKGTRLFALGALEVNVAVALAAL